MLRIFGKRWAVAEERNENGKVRFIAKRFGSIFDPCGVQLAVCDTIDEALAAIAEDKRQLEVAARNKFREVKVHEV